MKSFRDLRVWQQSMTLVETIYRLTRRFPKHETYGLMSQLQRAVVSVPSNIAEGHTREHLREYLQILQLLRLRLRKSRLNSNWQPDWSM